MQLINKLFRCSALHELIAQPKIKGEVLSQGAKSAIRRMVKEDKFQIQSFEGTRKTEKGNILEADVIKYSGQVRFRSFEKNTIRANTSLLTGEADIIDLQELIIIDTKCSWDFFSHPFFTVEAQSKAESAGYIVQLHGYFIAFEQYYKEQGLDVKFKHGEIDFWLMPCPEELLSKFDNDVKLVEKVEEMPIEDRLKTLIVPRDEVLIDRINFVLPHAQKYYKQCQIEINKWEI